MRDRFVTWGNLEDSRRLFTFELDADEAQIIRRVIPAAVSNEELLQTIINAWNNRTTMPFPEGTSTERIPLQASGTIVPEGAEVDDKVRVASAEREWPSDILSAQLRRQFRAEFEELHDVVGNLTSFDEGIFERLKGVWNKVQSELTNKVIRYEHTHDLRKVSDELFAKMKELRRGKEKAVRSNQDVFYENRRIERAGNQLAEQLGAAKMSMLKERASSKQAKLDDMLATEKDLQKRLDKIKKREEKALNKKKVAPENAVAVASSDGNTPSGKTRNGVAFSVSET